MSDTNAPKPHVSQPEPRAQAASQPQAPAQAPSAPTPFSFQNAGGAASPAAPASAAPKAPAKTPAKDGKGLSTFLKVSIILLIGLTVASISLLFIGDFEGRFERVFSTFVLFAVFVVLTAIDTSRERKNDWYAPVALIANTYILGLLLIVIWMTPYDSFSLMFEIFWKSLLVVVVTRLVIICCEVLLRAGESSGGATAKFAFVTSVLAVLSGILFTAPVGVSAFNLTIPDLYWKIATAVLILTALGLSVTLLLRWAGKSDERAAQRAAQRAAEAHAAPAPYVGGYPNQYPGTDYSQLGAPVQQQMVSPQPVQPQAPAAPAAQNDGDLLPWPTFADGRPIPAGPDGQPDFSVPGAPKPPQL